MKALLFENMTRNGQNSRPAETDPYMPKPKQYFGGNLHPSFHRLYYPSVFRFTAYIVIPMWPEGDPTSVPMQVLLFIGQSQDLVKLPHFHFFFIRLSPPGNPPLATSYYGDDV